MKIHDLMDRYLSVIKRQHSDGTYRFYVSHLNHFKRWLEKRAIFYVSEIEYHVIDDYIADMKKTAQNATINKRVGILKRMYREMRIDFDYLQAIKKLKEQKKTYSTIDNKSLKKIIDYSFTCNAEYNIVYNALILLLIDTGARINEIIKIEKRNIKLAENEILLTTTKTKEDRTVFFLNDTKEVIKVILKQKNKTPYLLYNTLKKRPLEYDDVRFFMRKLKSLFDLDKLHSHMFRHTLATKLIENNADLISVMRILGHKNIKTTERYLHLSKKHVKKVYAKTFNR